MSLPKCYSSQTASKIEGCCGETKSLKYTAHGGNGDTITSLQFGNLGFFHSDAFTQFLLCEILLKTSFLDGFTKLIGIYSLVDATLESVTLWCPNFTGASDYHAIFADYVRQTATHKITLSQEGSLSAPRYDLHAFQITSSSAQTMGYKHRKQVKDAYIIPILTRNRAEHPLFKVPKKYTKT